MSEFDDAAYDEAVESALCRNESPELALLELTHPERLITASELRLATLDEIAKAETDAFFQATLENCYRNIQKSSEALRASRDSAAIASSTVTFAESQARLGRALNAIAAKGESHVR